MATVLVVVIVAIAVVVVAVAVVVTSSLGSTRKRLKRKRVGGFRSLFGFGIGCPTTKKIVNSATSVELS